MPPPFPPALPPQNEVAAFTTCRESDTLVAIRNARNSEGVAQRISIMPRKRDLALTGGKNRVNPLDRPMKCYVQATIGYIVGQFRDNGTCCSGCEEHKGRFPFCVTVRDPQTGEVFFDGACVNCKWQNHPEKCSLYNPPARSGGGDSRQLPPPQNADDDDDDTMDEEEPVVIRWGTRARGKGRKPTAQEEEDDTEVDMDEKMIEAGDEDERNPEDHKENRKQRVCGGADNTDADSDVEIKPTRPIRKKTRGVAIPKAPSSQAAGVQVRAKAAKGKEKEGIKKNADGSRKRE